MTAKRPRQQLISPDDLRWRIACLGELAAMDSDVEDYFRATYERNQRCPAGEAGAAANESKHIIDRIDAIGLATEMKIRNPRLSKDDIARRLARKLGRSKHTIRRDLKSVDLAPKKVGSPR